VVKVPEYFYQGWAKIVVEVNGTHYSVYEGSQRANTTLIHSSSENHKVHADSGAIIVYTGQKNSSFTYQLEGVEYPWWEFIFLQQNVVWFWVVIVLILVILLFVVAAV
jgi:hypothetical protein